MLPTCIEEPRVAMGRRSPGANGPARADSAATTAMSPAAEAQRICLKLLTTRPRSRVELAETLCRRGIPEEVGEAVLDRLGEVGLVNDAAFAESAVYSSHHHRGLGRRALSAELRRKGVPEEIVCEAVATVGPEEEEQRARELVRRKLRSSTVRDPSTVARRLIAMLARKGYSEGLALRVLRDELGPGNWLADVEPGAD